MTLPAMKTASTLLVSIIVTTVPGTLFIGNTLMRSVASRMMSASLPGVSVPILASRWAAARAVDRRQLDRISRGQQARRVPLARECPLIGQRPLQRERRSHVGEHVRRHVALDIDAQAGPDAVIERRLKRRHPVTHLHLDRRRDRHVAAGIGDDLPAGVVQLRAVDVLDVRPEQSRLLERLQVARDEVRDHRSTHRASQLSAVPRPRPRRAPASSS